MQDIRHFNLKNTLIISLVIHILIVVIFSITIRKNPMEELIQPVEVTIESVADSMSDGMSQQLNNIQHSQAPVLNKPVKPDDATPVLPDKTLPVKKNIKNQDKKILEESFKKQNPETTKNMLKEKVVAKTGPKFDPNKIDINNSDQEMSQILNKEEKNNLADTGQNQMNDDISKILDEDGNNSSKNNSAVPDNDPLKGADWSAAPRKTLFFPDIASKIPEEYKKKGQNYIIKMRISFDKNGLAVKTEIIRTSGDPMIDSIFQTELRKIKVEAINRERVDEVVKTFTISVK